MIFLYFKFLDKVPYSVKSNIKITSAIYTDNFLRANKESLLFFKSEGEIKKKINNNETLHMNFVDINYEVLALVHK